MPKTEKETQEQKQIQREIAMYVMDTAMHIVHDSYLYGSDLWPSGGFKIGGPGRHTLGPPDTVYYGANPYGYEQDPIKGRLGFTMFNTAEKREAAIAEHLRTIFDHTVLNNIYFENEFKSSFQPVTHIWFTFTYLQTQK